LAWLDTCTYTWNYLKDCSQNYYKLFEKNLTKYRKQNLLPELRKNHEEVREVYAQVLQDVSHRLDRAYKTFFTLNKNGYNARLPRYKRRTYSFTYPQNTGFRFKGNRVRLNKLGWIKYRGTILEENEKTLTIKRSKTGKWYAYIVYDIEPKEHVFEKKQVGIDLGIEKFLVTSDGSYYPNPHIFKKYANRLKKANRNLSRKKRGSNRRKKALHRLRRVYEDMNNSIMDHAHKVSHELAETYEIIYVEDLNISGLRQGWTSKSLAYLSVLFSLR